MNKLKVLIHFQCLHIYILLINEIYILYYFLIMFRFAKDIINGPYHIFGQHTLCENYFCRGPKEREKNLVLEIIKCGLMNEIGIIYSSSCNE